MSRLLCVGDLNADIAVTIADALAIGSDTAGTIALHGGGSAANVATWAVRAGQPTRFVGAVGDDTIGDFLANELAGNGVDVVALRRVGARSRAVAAIIGGDGNRSLVSDLDTAVAPTADDYRPDWFADVAWLHLTAYTYLAANSRALFVQLIAEASERAIPYSIDPSAAQLLRASGTPDAALAAFAGATLLLPSRDEAAFLTGDDDPPGAARRLLDTAETVAVTCGANGAHVARRTGVAFHVDAAPTTVVNTLGCGDAFAGGYIAARMRGDDDLACARAAIGSAALATRLASAR